LNDVLAWEQEMVARLNIGAVSKMLEAQVSADLHGLGRLESKANAQLDYAISKGPAPPPKPFEWFYLLGLSPRERDICELIPTRLSYKEIGRALGISESTVKTNIRRIFLKIDVENRYALISALYAAGYNGNAGKSLLPVGRKSLQRQF
jgi:DNA-binding CsgD family transcriptional regulator